MEMTEKVRRVAVFCLSNFEPLSLRTCLILPHMLGLKSSSFPYNMFLLFLFFYFFIKKKKKIGGEDVEFLFFL